MEKKIKLFIDADDTILESSKTFIEILNERFNISPPKTYGDLKDWCYRSIYHFCTKDIINEIYDSDTFFEKVKINEIFKNFYNEHENDFEWFIVTKGHPKNIEQKKKYFRKHMPKAQVIGCLFHSPDNVEYDKSHIDMKYGIQIDDRTDCLVGTNANIKILFKNYREFKWNQTSITAEPIYKIDTWSEIVNVLNASLKNPDIFMETERA